MSCTKDKREITRQVLGQCPRHTMRFTIEFSSPNFCSTVLPVGRVLVGQMSEFGHTKDLAAAGAA